MTSVRSLVARTVQELKAARALLWSPGSTADPPTDRIIDVDEADVRPLRPREPVTARGNSSPTAHRGSLPGGQFATQASETIGTADVSTGSDPDGGADLAGGLALSSPERATGGARPTARHVTGRQLAPRLRAVAVLLVLGLVVVVGVREAVMTRPPTVSGLMERAGWGGEVRVLKVGVNGDIPGVSECLVRMQREPGAAAPPVRMLCAGFDANIATYVTRWLGKDPDFYNVLPEQRGRLEGNYRVVDDDGRTVVETAVALDLVVAAYSMTKQRQEEGVVFAGPYLQTDATVLTRADVKYVPDLETLGRVVNLRGVGDDPYQGALNGKVCTVSTGTGVGYLQNVAKLEPSLIVQRVSNQECVDELLNGPGKDGRVVAIVTDAALLAGFQARYPEKLVMHNVTNVPAIEEKWGIAVGRIPAGRMIERGETSGVPTSCADSDKKIDDKVWARQQLVLLALKDLRASGRWNDYLYELQKGQEGNGAAGSGRAPKNRPRLLPAGAPKVGQPIAVPAQPVLDPAPCPVSRWPWEIGSAAGPAAP